MIDLLFVYGTLRDEKNNYGAFLHQNSVLFGNAKLRASLFDLGDYPGAVINSDGPDEVQGILLKMNDPEKVMGVLDIYEGFGVDQPQPNEFVRILTEVETIQGPVSCWVYVYNLSVAHLRPLVAQSNTD